MFSYLFEIANIVFVESLVTTFKTFPISEEKETTSQIV